jgi:uncharacterized protein YaeQ
VIDIDAASVEAVGAMLERGMRLTAMIQDGELQLMSELTNVALRPRARLRSAAMAATGLAQLQPA